jgi:hypothetical protein
VETAIQLHNFVTRPTVIRGAVEAWRPWIEAKLGVPWPYTVIIETSHNLAQIGVRRVLGVASNQLATTSAARRLETFLVAAETPPALPPLLDICRSNTTVVDK